MHLRHPMTSHRIALAGAALLALSSPTIAHAQTRSLGIDTTTFDRSVRPQDDFFRFVNGGWIKRTAIPEDASRWGAFDELNEHSQQEMRTLLEEAARSDAP